MKQYPCLLLCMVIVWLTSCGGQSAHQQEGGDTVAFRYAQRITIVKHKDYTEVSLANPWKEGKLLNRVSKKDLEDWVNSNSQ